MVLVKAFISSKYLWWIAQQLQKPGSRMLYIKHKDFTDRLRGTFYDSFEAFFSSARLQAYSSKSTISSSKPPIRADALTGSHIPKLFILSSLKPRSETLKLLLHTHLGLQCLIFKGHHSYMSGRLTDAVNVSYAPSIVTT